jgi:hypothetical protein
MTSTEKAEKPTLMPIWALEQLLTADTWEKKRKVLEEQWEFLVTMRDATDIIDALRKEGGSDDGPQYSDDARESLMQRGSLLVYRGLLVNSRLLGIDHAWSVFMMSMSAFQL